MDEARPPRPPPPRPTGSAPQVALARARVAHWTDAGTDTGTGTGKGTTVSWQAVPPVQAARVVIGPIGPGCAHCEREWLLSTVTLALVPAEPAAAAPRHHDRLANADPAGLQRAGAGEGTQVKPWRQLPGSLHRRPSRWNDHQPAGAAAIRVHMHRVRRALHHRGC